MFMNIFKLIVIFILISNCTLNKVVKHHGVHNLKKKNNKLELFNTNKNDVISQFGIPSTKSSFDNEVWIYIERKTSSSEVTSLGTKRLLLNDILILEFDTRGLLVKKDYLTKNDMNKIKISTDTTSVINKKDKFIDTFLSSMRQKINDPLGVKKAK
jgi:outer membrane protein assembly factor BamE (lipoprotein component of BamABCDE complex)